MATYTPNYNLKKPATSDLVSIADINGNMDAVDAALKAADDAIAGCAKLSANNVFTGSNTFPSNNISITGPHNSTIGSDFTQDDLKSYTKNNVLLYRLMGFLKTNGRSGLWAQVRDSNGNYTNCILADGDMGGPAITGDNNTFKGINTFKKQPVMGGHNLLGKVAYIYGDVSSSGNFLAGVAYNQGEYIEIKGMLTISDATPTTATVINWPLLENILNLDTTRNYAEGYWLVADNPADKSGLYGYAPVVQRSGTSNNDGLAFARVYTKSGSIGPWGQHVLGTGSFFVDFCLTRRIS